VAEVSVRWRWAQDLAARLSPHSDSAAVIRAGRKGAKRRTRRRDRRAHDRLLREAQELAREMDEEMGPVTETELEELRKVWPP
jgi:hypothetical protein